MSVKYKKGLYWIICVETNDLKLESILNFNPNVSQVVKNPTRLNPPTVSDPVITTLVDLGIPWYNYLGRLPPIT